MPLVEIVVPPPAPTNVPAFLAKLWKMVENPDTDDYICWTGDGSSFRIRDQTQFAASLLPYYYKHSNMASFVRQLNMYGFHKVIALHSGNLKSEKEEIEFAHTYFLRGQEFLLDQIKRKSSSSSKAGQQGGQGSFMMQEPVIITKLDPGQDQPPSHTPDMVTEFLAEVGGIKERQEDLDTKMENMRSENEALWGEVLSLRQKHHQQQKIVNKLIQFLVALVQPRISKGIKRKLRHPSFPAPKLAIAEGVAALNNFHDNLEEDAPSPKEAKVEEIAEEIEECHLSDILASDTTQARAEEGDHSAYTMVDPATVTPSLRQIKTEKLAQDLSPGKLVNKSLDLELDGDMQRELDSLKDILSGSGQICLDTSFMSGLMSPSGDSSDLLNGMKLFTDSLLTPPAEAHLPDTSPPLTPPPAHDLKFLTYADQDTAAASTSASSILALAAESSGISLDEDLLSTPPRHAFGMDMDFH